MVLAFVIVVVTGVVALVLPGGCFFSGGHVLNVTGNSSSIGT